MNTNLAAFLRVIREGESSQEDSAYRMLVGGGYFDSFAAHPNQLIYLPGLQVASTAAGAYQFLYRTWAELAKTYSYKDFSPATQDAAAVQLIRRRKAYDDVIAGRFEQAILKCNKEWASLPGSPYGQRTMTMEECKEVYEQYGGNYGMQEEGQKAPEEIVENKETSMWNVFVQAAVGALSSVIPELGKLFSSSDVAQRNTKAAEIVLNVAKKSVGASNEQELIDSLKDPAQVALVKQAVSQNWFEISEAAGGVKEAREAELAFVKSGKPWYSSPTFLMGLCLLPLVYLIVGSITLGFGPEWPSDVRSALAGSIVGTIIGALAQYYYGASRNAPSASMR